RESVEAHRPLDALGAADTASVRTAAPLLTLALISCSALAPAPPPSAFPTEYVIPTRSPVTSPTPFTGHYGFLVATGAGYAVRREADATAIATIDLENIAVSPDGHLIAGFTKGGGELRVADIATPNNYKSRPLPSGETGLYVAWSVDQSGVIYSVGGKGWSALRTFTFAGQPPAEIARLDGVTLRPALWDPQGGELAAAFVVDGGFAREYVVIRGTDPPERKELPDKQWQQTPAVSGDGRWVVLASTTEATVRVFQSDIPNVILESHGVNSDATSSAIGRPQSSHLGVVFDREFLIWDPPTN